MRATYSAVYTVYLSTPGNNCICIVLQLIIVREIPVKIMAFARLKRLTMSVRVQAALEERNVIEVHVVFAFHCCEIEAE